MFTPKTKLARNSSISGTKKTLNTLERPSLYSAKPKSFFSACNNRNRSLNVSELALESDDGTAVENILMEFKSHLPLAISETLIEADKDKISGRIVDSSWLVIVYNQKLLIWNISDEDQLIELPISYSTNCDLVVLDLYNKNHITCFSANRDGLCRFWHRPQAANSYAELQLNLQLGEACVCMYSYAQNHILLGTSQGRLFSIDTRAATSLSFRLIKSGGGMLFGLSKRVSYLFGSDNDSSFQKPIQKILCQDSGPLGLRDVYVLTSESLQKWSMSETGEKIIYDLLLVVLFEKLAPKHLALDNAENLSITLMDIIIIRPHIVILVGIHEKSAQETNYALGYLALENNMPIDLFNFELARFSYPLLPGGHMVKFNCMYRFDSDALYFYNKDSVACIKLKKEKSTDCDSALIPLLCVHG